MDGGAVRGILVPGAWMGKWIWEPLAQRLTRRGFTIETITLKGLESDCPGDVAARVRLADHVEQLIDHISRSPQPVVLISHSYSALPAAMAADGVKDAVQGLIHIGGFLPVDGQSLLDAWGDSAESREEERKDIVAAGNLWAPPTKQMLDDVPDLAPEDRDLLVRRLAPHPGLTITDHAELTAPVSVQPTTYVALSVEDGAEEAWRHAPRAARTSPGWRGRFLPTGHWPMLSAPEATADLLAEEIEHYSNRTS